MIRTIKWGAISIHAPARGATRLKREALGTCQFQSTLPQGERRLGYSRSAGSRYFNPRSRKGSDGNMSKIPREAWNFNPRSRKGSDWI